MPGNGNLRHELGVVLVSSFFFILPATSLDHGTGGWGPYGLGWINLRSWCGGEVMWDFGVELLGVTFAEHGFYYFVGVYVCV